MLFQVRAFVARLDQVRSGYDTLDEVR